MEDMVKQLTGPSWLPSILSIVFADDASFVLPEEEGAEEEKEEEEEEKEEKEEEEKVQEEVLRRSHRKICIRVL